MKRCLVEVRRVLLFIHKRGWGLNYERGILVIRDVEAQIVKGRDAKDLCCCIVHAKLPANCKSTYWFFIIILPTLI